MMIGALTENCQPMLWNTPGAKTCVSDVTSSPSVLALDGAATTNSNANAARVRVKTLRMVSSFIQSLSRDSIVISRRLSRKQWKRKEIIVAMERDIRRRTCGSAYRSAGAAGGQAVATFFTPA